MIDPASLRNWIDPPNSVPPLPFAANDPPNEIDKALDTLAEAIRQAEHGERNSMASYLMRLPSVSRTAKILAQLPSSQLMAFLERHRADERRRQGPDAEHRRIRGGRPNSAGEPLSPRHHGLPHVCPQTGL